MKPKLVFLVMSAVHPVEIVRELCRSLAPQTVLVHHDFAQNPDFPLDEPNVIFVPNPKRTGWGIWAFSQGVFHGMDYAVRNLDFDYLQLLSPTCLPIKPLAAFEAHVAARKTDADFGWLDLYTNDDALMSVAYRMFAPANSLRHRVLRRLFLVYFGSSKERLDVEGVQLRTHPRDRRELSWAARIALKATQAWVRPSASRHIFDESFRPYFGSAWFGAHRHVVEWMLERYGQPDIDRQFSELHIPEELVIPTLLKNSGFKGGPYNHCIITFVGANPKWLEDEDFEALRTSPAFFARKFPVELTSPIRRRVLKELVGIDEVLLAGAGRSAGGGTAAGWLPDERIAAEIAANAPAANAAVSAGRTSVEATPGRPVQMDRNAAETSPARH
jgi:hypothetical protein